MTITDKLNELAEHEAHKAIIAIDKKKLVDGILTDEIKKQLAAIDAEFEAPEKAINENIKSLTADIKEAVIANGEKVKGEVLQAIYVKGRTSWDTKALTGYAITNPDILMFRKIGKPSVRISKA